MATKLTLIRNKFYDDLTGGDLYINDEWFCNTEEPTDRHLEDYKDNPAEGKKVKIWGKTAIPRGTYPLCTQWWSRKNDYYPLILGTAPLFTGVYFHEGNFAPQDSQGCPLLGIWDEKTRWVMQSKLTFRRFREKLHNNFDDCILTIL